MFCKKGVLKSFTKFTENTFARVSFFNKVAGLRPTISLEKRIWHRCFPVNFVKFLGTSFYTEHLHWLLLLLSELSNDSLVIDAFESVPPSLTVLQIWEIIAHEVSKLLFFENSHGLTRAMSLAPFRLASIMPFLLWLQI